MKCFAQLYQTLDRTTSSRQKIDALVQYLQRSAPEDAAWAVYFLAGGKLKRLIASSELRLYVRQQTCMPEWLFESCYQSVGDLAETITLLLPPQQCTRDESLSQWVEHCLLPLRAVPAQERLEHLHQALGGWDTETRFIALKLMTSGLRVGVSRLMVARALAKLTDLPSTEIAQRMVGYFSSTRTPQAQAYEQLISTGAQVRLQPGQPYPFFLAQSWSLSTQEMAEQLGDAQNWQMEYKWDGIRAQLVTRQGQSWLWSRGEELISDQFPEFSQSHQALPEGTVLDGEILIWYPDHTLAASFAELQKRLGRKQVTTKLMQSTPAIIMAYDILEFEGCDVRDRPLHERRKLLQDCVQQSGVQWLRLSPALYATHWSEVAQWQTHAREHRAEGLMIKALNGCYGIGRTRSAGLWFKFKLDPMRVDAVLLYAQKGHGRRANLYSDYTFALWHQAHPDQAPTLVPIAKAYSGLSDEEMRAVDAVIKKSTIESFGPVRRVEPKLVFEIGFEGIMPSTRHKSGVALRFPRMLRWRIDKPVQEANTLEELKALL
jgi:DNA ligase 1